PVRDEHTRGDRAGVRRLPRRPWARFRPPRWRHSEPPVMLDRRAARAGRPVVDLLQRCSGAPPMPPPRPLEPAAIIRGNGERLAGDTMLAGIERTPLVGRQQELALLRERLERAARGVGGVVALAGEAGIGKSRLIVEALVL